MSLAKEIYTFKYGKPKPLIILKRKTQSNHWNDGKHAQGYKMNQHRQRKHVCFWTHWRKTCFYKYKI